MQRETVTEENIVVTEETSTLPAEASTESQTESAEEALTPEEVSLEPSFESESDQEAQVEVFLTPEVALTDFYSSPRSRKLQLLSSNESREGEGVEGNSQQISGRRFSNFDVNAAIVINLMGSQAGKTISSIEGEETEESRISLSKTFSSSKKSTAREVSSKDTFDDGEELRQNLTALEIAKDSVVVQSEPIPVAQKEPLRGDKQGRRRSNQGSLSN